MSGKNIFTELYAIDCSSHIASKNNFSYLSWPFAVAQLRAHDPEATWETLRFEGMPYLKTECGYFVEVAVTVKGITLSQIHPVLDHRNKPIAQPDAFHINTSIQRCLVKAIALHGLGLSIYAGEDVPDASMFGPTHIQSGEAEEIEQLIEQTGSDRKSFLAYMQAPSVQEITVGAQHSKALAALQSKHAKQAEKAANEAAEKEKQQTEAVAPEDEEKPSSAVEEAQPEQDEAGDEVKPEEVINEQADQGGDGAGFEGEGQAAPRRRRRT